MVCGKVCGDYHELEACKPMLFASALEGFLVFENSSYGYT